MRRMTWNTIRDFPESRSDLKCFLFLQYKDGGAHEGSRTRRLWLWLQYQSSWGLDMSRLSLSNERSGANCGMWSPTLQYLYGVSFQVIICIIQTTKGHMWQNSRNNRVNEISHRWWMTFFVCLYFWWSGLPLSIISAERARINDVNILWDSVVIISFPVPNHRPFVIRSFVFSIPKCNHSNDGHWKELSPLCFSLFRFASVFLNTHFTLNIIWSG